PIRIAELRVTNRNSTPKSAILRILEIICGPILNCNIFKQFQVIGILNEGNQLQMIIIDTPRGYIFYVRYKKFYEVSGHLLKI
ncbi:3488_t:CDS:1, partial [Rhizophagus irregularis]